MARPLGPTKDRILDTAELLFAEHGYDGVSLRAIASAADATQPLLHYHFKSKAGLYAAVWERWYELPELQDRRFEEEGEARLGATQSLEVSLRRLVEDFLTAPMMLAQSERGRRFLSILGRELSDPKESERGLLARFLDPLENVILEQLSNVMPNAGKIGAVTGYRIMAATAQALFVNPSRGVRPSDAIIRDNLEEAKKRAVDLIVRGLVFLDR